MATGPARASLVMMALLLGGFMVAGPLYAQRLETNNAGTDSNGGTDASGGTDPTEDRAGEAATPLGEDGYLWHGDGGSGATYPGDGTEPWRYNPTGEDIIVARNGTGRYTVTVSATDQPFVPVVTAYTTVGNHCTIAGFAYPGTSVEVTCFDSAGFPVDEEFTMRWTESDDDAALGIGIDGSIFAGAGHWVDDATVQITAVGTYDVTIPDTPSFEQDHVQVSAVDGNHHCTAGGWDATVITVHCYNPAGDPADSAFTVLRIGSNDEARAWIDPTTTSPDPAYSHNPQGVDPTFFKLATGRFTVELPEHLVDNGGSVAITAYGDGTSATKCSVRVWTSTSVDVSCTDVAGAPIDSSFGLLFTRFRVCQGLPATIEIGNDVPTDGDDVIIGTDDDDLVDALVGNDIVCGGDGNDLVIGGLGDDVIDGQSGDDTIAGNAGNDHLDGGIGDDLVFAGSGDDVVRGGDGSDVIGGSSGVDEIHGGPGSDALSGGSDDDILVDGGDDNDAVNGGGGNDAAVTGGPGDDTVSGNGGQDTVTGGDGDDQVRGGQADDTVLGGPGDDFVAGNDGDDTCDGEAGVDTASGNCETIRNIP